MRKDFRAAVELSTRRIQRVGPDRDKEILLFMTNGNFYNIKLCFRNILQFSLWRAFAVYVQLSFVIA